MGPKKSKQRKQSQPDFSFNVPSKKGNLETPTQADEITPWFPNKLPFDKIQEAISKTDSAACVHLRSFPETQDYLLFEGGKSRTSGSCYLNIAHNGPPYYLRLVRSQPVIQPSWNSPWGYQKHSDGFYSIFFQQPTQVTRHALHCPTFLTLKGTEAFKKICPLLPSELIRNIFSLSPSRGYLQTVEIESFDQITEREKIVIFWTRSIKDKSFLSIDGICLTMKCFEHAGLDEEALNSLLLFDESSSTSDETGDSMCLHSASWTSTSTDGSDEVTVTQSDES